MKLMSNMVECGACVPELVCHLLPQGSETEVGNPVRAV